MNFLLSLSFVVVVFTFFFIIIMARGLPAPSTLPEVTVMSSPSNTMLPSLDTPPPEASSSPQDYTSSPAEGSLPLLDFSSVSFEAESPSGASSPSQGAESPTERVLAIPKIRHGDGSWVTDSVALDVVAIGRALKYLPKSDGYSFTVPEETYRLSFNGPLEGSYREFCMVLIKHFEDGGFRLPLKRFFLDVMFFLGIAPSQFSSNS